VSEDVYDCPFCGAEVHDIDVKCAACGMSLASTGARRMVGQLVMDQYEVLEVIGQGGMAIVYAARHQVTGQEVALKVLPPEMAAHRGLQSRFVAEARALASLDHPNIVHLYNFGADQGCFVLAMQLVRGETWEKLIVGGDLPWRRSVEIARDVTRALEYAHGSGIVHRDMKPSNVLIRDTDGSSMVMDFGIAKGEKSSKLTDTGQTMGTVRYMSPEQVRGKEVDARSDLYSLGVSLYEALAGETPFDGETHYDIMNAHLKVVPPPLGEKAPDLPGSLVRVVHWMISKRAADRPPSAAAAGAAFDAILEGREPDLPRSSDVGSMRSIAPGVVTVAAAAVTAEPVEVIATRRGFPLAMVLTAAALVVAAIAGFLYLRPSGQGAAAVDAAARPAIPTNAALVDARPTELPVGFEVAVELDYPEDGLRILAAPDAPTEGIRDSYRAGLDRWRRYVESRGLSWPELARPVPKVTVLLGPADLVCDRTELGSGEAVSECRQFGTYRVDERTMRVPTDVAYRDLALHSAVPMAHCATSDRCMDEADQYLFALFSR
jgi:tRNA A-37 threonylcarbamoyl transferase component Bud32